MKYLMSVLALMFATAGSAHAAGVGVRAGTTGIGADLGWGVMPTLGARVGASGMQLNTHVDSGDVRYDAKAKLANLNGFLDWSPLGPFRITGGLIANDNKLDLTSPSNSFTINGNTYSGNLSGTVKSGRSLAPYLGVGYGNVWTRGVNFYFDLGIMFQGKPRVDLNLTCTGGPCASAQSDVDAEERRLADKLDKYKYFPVLNLGLTIGF